MIESTMPQDSAERTLLVTGFEGFGPFKENPSAVLAEQCGLPFRRLEVSYSAVDEFVDSDIVREFEAVLLLGVAANALRFRLETVATNNSGKTPDVRGMIGFGPIAPQSPRQLGTTMFVGSWDSELVESSVDAGDYLCNYLYYRMLSRWPSKAIGFVHVPPIEQLPLAQQKETLNRLIRDIFERCR